jgi:hypothetical protein
MIVLHIKNKFSNLIRLGFGVLNYKMGERISVMIHEVADCNEQNR